MDSARDWRIATNLVSVLVYLVFVSCRPEIPYGYRQRVSNERETTGASTVAHNPGSIDYDSVTKVCPFEQLAAEEMQTEPDLEKIRCFVPKTRRPVLAIASGKIIGIADAAGARNLAVRYDDGETAAVYFGLTATIASQGPISQGEQLGTFEPTADTVCATGVRIREFHVLEAADLASLKEEAGTALNTALCP